jgi:hypothetical protein
MAEQNVVIKIQADVSKATNDVKALQEVIAKLSTSGTQAASGTERVSNAAKKTATASQLLDREIKKVVAGQGNLQKVSILAKKALDEQAAAAKRLQQASAAVEQAVGKQGAAALSGSGQIGGLADASGSASFALLSLGQAFQDSAQFGMGFAQGLRAVNNNIQQTFTALALGSVQAGGFTNLLKLMGGSLWGPGGLILGFSAVSAALEFFSTRAQRAKKEGDNLAEAFNKLFTFSSGVEAVNISSSESFERLADGYEALAKEQDKLVEANTEIIYQETRAGRARVGERLNEEAKAAQVAATQFRLYAQEQKKSAETARQDEEALEARNRVLGINGVRVENLTTKRRDLTRALVDLQTPLSDEAKAIQQGNIALQNQIDALEKARDLREQLQAAIGARTLSDQEKENVIAEERIDLYEREREAREQIAINSRLASDAAFAADRERVGLLESVAASGLATVAEFNTKFLETNTVISSIHAQSVLTEEQFAKLFSTGGIEEFIRKLRDEHTVLTDLQKITQDLSDLRGQINSADFEAIAIKELELDLEQQFADAQRQNIQLAALKASLEAGDETQLAITTAQITAIKDVNEGLREQVKLLLIKRGMTVEEIEGIFSGLGITEDDVEKADQMTRAMERLNAAMARTAAQGIARVATGLLDVAIGGESFKDAILGPIADMAIQLGKIAIATGLTMEKLKFSFANPGSAIAAGVALVVAGKLVKSTISNASKSSASSAGVSSSRFSSPNAFSGAGNISNPMFSGAGILTPNNMVTVEVQGRLRGSDIYLSGRSETRSRSRMGVAG